MVILESNLGDNYRVDHNRASIRSPRRQPFPFQTVYIT